MSRENERLLRQMDREIDVEDQQDPIGAVGASIFAVAMTFGMFFLWLMGVG